MRDENKIYTIYTNQRGSNINFFIISKEGSRSRSRIKYPKGDQHEKGLDILGGTYCCPRVRNYRYDSESKTYVADKQPFAMVVTAAPSFSPRHDPDGKTANSFNQNREHYIRYMSFRMRSICEYALLLDIETLGLGALGCGVFYNNPYLVAAIFRAILSEDKYRKLAYEFVIYEPGNNVPLNGIFNDVMNCSLENLQLILDLASPFDVNLYQFSKESFYKSSKQFLKNNLSFAEYLMNLRQQKSLSSDMMPITIPNNTNDKTTDAIKGADEVKEIKEINDFLKLNNAVVSLDKAIKNGSSVCRLFCKDQDVAITVAVCLYNYGISSRRDPSKQKPVKQSNGYYISLTPAQFDLLRCNRSVENQFTSAEEQAISNHIKTLHNATGGFVAESSSLTIESEALNAFKVILKLGKQGYAREDIFNYIKADYGNLVKDNQNNELFQQLKQGPEGALDESLKKQLFPLIMNK